MPHFRFLRKAQTIHFYILYDDLCALECRYMRYIAFLGWSEFGFNAHQPYEWQMVHLYCVLLLFFKLQLFNFFLYFVFRSIWYCCCFFIVLVSALFAVAESVLCVKSRISS